MFRVEEGPGYVYLNTPRHFRPEDFILGDKEREVYTSLSFNPIARYYAVQVYCAKLTHSTGPSSGP